jgi:hypothetical protein
VGARFSESVQTVSGTHPGIWLRAGRSGDRIHVKARFSAPVRTSRRAQPTSCTMGMASFPGVKSGRGVTLITHPLLCRGRGRVELYLYFPYWPYGLYRDSVPVQYSYTSTTPVGCRACTEPQCLYSRAIPLLPLWAVLPVQSLSACTVQLYLYSPYGPYCLYRVSVPVQYSYTSTPSACPGCILSLPFICLPPPLRLSAVYAVPDNSNLLAKGTVVL